MPPLDMNTIQLLANPDGSFTKEAEEDIRKSMYVSGVTQEARGFVWKLALGYYDFSMTRKERDEYDAMRREQYYKIRTQWESFVDDQLDNWLEMRQTLEQIDKDVQRTDKNHEKFSSEENVQMLTRVLRTYALYNHNVGYGQGMNDICSQVMDVTLDEPEVFWLFVYVMNVVEDFYTASKQPEMSFNEVGEIIRFVNPSLYDYFARNGINCMFCYKWIVLLFKREFSTKNCLRIWDTIFSYPQRKMYFFICSAIIISHADEIVSSQMGFDGMVAFLQGLHKKIPAEIVFYSDMIYQQFTQLADKSCIHRIL